MLQLYVDSFRNAKNLQRGKIEKLAARLEEEGDSNLQVERIFKIMKDFKSAKETNLLAFYGPITIAQVIIAAVSSGKFLANDFVKCATELHVDCPIPLVPKLVD